MTPPELYQIHKQKLTLNFHQGQTQAWDSTARFTAMIAGTQSGKTSWGPFWLYRAIYGGWGWEGFGGGDYLAVTASYDMFKLKMLPELKAVFEVLFGVGRYWGGDKVIELKDPASGQFWATNSTDPMWGRIILRSASAEGGLESATALAAWLDEAGHDDFTLLAWEAVLRRLSLSRGPVLITTTPYNLGWLKQQVYDPWRNGGLDYNVIQFDSTYNPRFSQAEFKDAQKRLPSWKFNMFYRGLFERPAGMIYGDFVDDYRENDGSLVEPFELPSTWPRYVGIDPGAVNTATIWLAHDIDHDVYYAYRESLKGGLSTAEHAEKALSIARRNHENVHKWAVGAKSEVQQRLDWQAAGVLAKEPPFHDVESGIDRIIALLRQKRLFIFDSLNGLRDQFMTYARVLDAEGNPTEKIKNKETYHYLDALRYGVAATKIMGSPIAFVDLD